MKRTLKVKYKFPDTYNPFYVNGAWGGISGQGEININFYHERQGLPKEGELDISDQGLATGQRVTDPDDHNQVIVRYIQGGVVMNLDTAKTIRTWLDDKILMLEKMQKGKKA